VLAPVAREAALVERRQLIVAEPGLPAARRIEAAKDVEERRLAAAGRAEQDDELVWSQREIDAAQRVHLDVAAAVDLGQVTAAQGGRTFRS
jgi:hypothetical protein